jgi:hypothetical protein
MGVKYCSKGHKATYNTSPPAECPTCKQPYVKAFANAVSPAPMPVTTPAAPKTSIARPTYRPARPIDDQTEESESYDKGEMQAWAEELAASVGDLIVVSSPKSDSVRLGDMIKNPDAYGHVGQRGHVDLSRAAE